MANLSDFQNEVSMYEGPWNTIPEAWAPAISSSLGTAGGYLTYFTLSSGSDGDADWCSPTDLHIWGSCNCTEFPIDFDDSGRFWNSDLTGSAGGLDTWIAASGSMDISQYWVSGSVAELDASTFIDNTIASAGRICSGSSELYA